MRKLILFTLAAVLLGIMAIPAHAYTHPCVPTTLAELDTIKDSLNQEPWKSGYAPLANASTPQLTWQIEGPFANVSRAGAYDQNLVAWQNSMGAVYNLARMWYFTGNAAYAQKARDILIACATSPPAWASDAVVVEHPPVADRNGIAPIVRPEFSLANHPCMKPSSALSCDRRSACRSRC